MSRCQVIIFGEMHGNISEISEIHSRIKDFNPDYLLHELLYEDKALDSKTILSRLNSCQNGGLCDPRINKDIYQFGMDNGISLVGIDLDNSTSLNLPESFKKREQHMVHMISTYMGKASKLAVVVGDTHLRESTTKELGAPSYIQKAFRNNPNITIIRSKYGELR